MTRVEAISRHFCFFDSAIGLCGLLWNESAIERVQLPEKSQAEARRRLTDKFLPCKKLEVADAPAWIQDAVQKLQDLLLHGVADLTLIPIDLRKTTPFFKMVFEAARRIPPGQTSTYGALAKTVGSPDAARAVGQAMGRNPMPLIIPCHRVLAAGGRLGGFSAFGGIVTKQQLLAKEQAAGLDWQNDFCGSASQAVAWLKTQDEKLGELIDRVGACSLLPKRGDSVFAALAQAIVYQQLHGKAAATIFGRFKDLFPPSDFPQPQEVLDQPEERLRSAGLSRSKALSIKDLASKIIAGEIPPMQTLAGMSDQDIVKTLVKVRGIGPWTAEMLLIFDLGRVDILPISDYGVRKGFSVAFGKRTLPSGEALAKYGERWKPYRSLASWYLWRAADLANSQ